MKTISTILILFGLLLSMPLVSASYGYGNSSITISQSSLGIFQGGNGAVNYTVNLAKGNTWGTTFNIYNPTPGITTNATDTQGDPPYSGTLTVYVASSVKAGSYQIALSASGDDPSESTVNLTINVMYPLVTPVTSNSTKPTTSSSNATNVTTTTTTTGSSVTSPTLNNSTTNTTTTSSYSSGSTTWWIIGGIIVVIIIIAVIAWWMMKK